MPSPSPPVVFSPSPPPVIVRERSPVIVRETSPWVEPAPVVYRERYVRPTDAAFWNGVWTARAEGVAVAASAAYLISQRREQRGADGEEADDEDAADTMVSDRIDYARELRETHDLMRTLEKELAAVEDSLVAQIGRPANGRYTGESAEDDAGDQAVATNLRFGADGTIRGSGYDGVDGSYSIQKGRWAPTRASGASALSSAFPTEPARVAWIEEYEEGFSVALRGQVLPDGTIRALWASSVGVGGSVVLQPP